MDSNALSVTINNKAPSVHLSTPAATPVTGLFKLAALASPDAAGSATIAKWCLTIDGAPWHHDIVSRLTGIYGLYADLDLWGTFDATTGCWTSTNNPQTAAFEIPGRVLTNGAHTFQITVTDSTGRTGSGSLSVTTDNPQPSITATGGGLYEGATISSGYLNVAINAYTDPDLLFTEEVVCLDTWSCTNRAAGWSMRYDYFNFSRTTANLKNGPHTFRMKLTDTLGRTTQSVLNFTVANPSPAVRRVVPSKVAPTGTSTSATARLTVTTVGTAKVVVKWGTNSRALTASKTFTIASGAATTSALNIGGLRWATRYYFQVIPSNANSTAATRPTTSVVTAAKPFIRSTRCWQQSYYDPYTYDTWWEHWFVYTWSTGATTSSSHYYGAC
jgi:hypothetical protein